MKTFRDGREVLDTKKTYDRKEYKARTQAMANRQRQRCAICSHLNMDLEFDHQAGRGMGGAHRDDRIEIEGQWNNAAVCHICNGFKGSRRYHWVDGDYVPA
jgi:hypothetical protein